MPIPNRRQFGYRYYPMNKINKTSSPLFIGSLPPWYDFISVFTVSSLCAGVSQDKVHANPGSGIAGLSWDFPGIQGFPGIVPDIRDSSGIINHEVGGSRNPCFEIAGLSWDFPGIQDSPGIIHVFRDSSGIINHGVCGSRDPCFRHFRIVLGLSGNPGFS